MKRKRFIKLMQSKGMQRNEAVIFAEEVRKIHFPFGNSAYEVFSHVTIERRYKNKFTLRIQNRYAFLSYFAIKKPSQAVIYFGDSGDKWWLRSPIAVPNQFTYGVSFGFVVL